MMQLELRWYQHSAVVEVTKLTRTQAGPDSESEIEFEPRFDPMLDD